MGLIGSKPSKEVPAVPVGYLPTTGLLVKLPGLVEYMSSTRWEDGAVRVPATVTVFIEDGHVKAALNDRALSRSAYASGETLEVCLRSLEGHLQSGDIEWRPWKGRK